MLSAKIVMDNIGPSVSVYRIKTKESTVNANCGIACKSSGSVLLWQVGCRSKGGSGWDLDPCHRPP